LIICYFLHFTRGVLHVQNQKDILQVGLSINACIVPLDVLCKALRLTTVNVYCLAYNLLCLINIDHENRCKMTVKSASTNFLFVPPVINL